MPATAIQKNRYWDAAAAHLDWCHERDIDIVSGRWDLEDPISGLLLAAMLQPSSSKVVLNTLCRQAWNRVRVTAAWWPSKYIDLVVNFTGDGSAHMLVVDNKHLTTNSNQPGWRSLKRKGLEHEICWQTEKTLCEIDKARAKGDIRVLGGPFDPTATICPVFLDAAGRTMEEAFPIYEWMVPPHRHDQWSAVSYAELAEGMRTHYERKPTPLLEPLLGQIFAPAER